MWVEVQLYATLPGDEPFNVYISLNSRWHITLCQNCTPWGIVIKFLKRVLLHIFCQQISDIHISKYRDHHRARDLKQFCNENIDVIRPVAVLATGKLACRICRHPNSEH